MVQNMNKTPVQKKRTGLTQTINPVESIKDLGQSVVKDTASQFKKIGTGIFDSFFSNNYTPDNLSFGENLGFGQKAETAPSQPRKEFSLFNYQEYYEREIVKKQIKELTEQVKREIELLKKAGSSLLAEVKDIEKLSLESLPDKPGIYHIRFLELVLSILRTLRAKIGESRTWMQAMITKKKKRGSLFVTRAKKQGTQYSLSQELQSARSIQ